MVAEKNRLIDKELSEEKKKQHNIILKQLNLFSKQTFDRMQKEGVPPTPENYRIYFDKVLETKPLTQQQNIHTFLALDETKEAGYIAKIERDIHDAFTLMRGMMETIGTLYTKTNTIKKITEQKKQEMAQNPSKVTLLSYEEDLDAMIKIFDKQMAILKKQYTGMTEIAKNFNNQSIFDKKYDVYNKKYLLKMLDTEIGHVNTLGYQSTILGIKVNPDSLKGIRLQRDRDMIVKTIAKMILKRSKRSDVVAHYEETVFMIVLRHTDLENAKIAVERIEEMIELSNFIVDSENIEVRLDFGLLQIVPNRTKEELISRILDKLKHK